MNLRHRALLGAVALAIIAAPAYAQQSSTVTQADVQRLQDNVYLADRDLSQLRSRDATRATQLGTELDDLRDEVVYLKVKLRKERTLSRTEYADVRDRIEDVRSRARGDVAAAAPTPAPATASTASSSTASSATSTRSTTTTASGVEVSVGTEIDVRLQNTLNSGTAQVEDRFEGTSLTDVSVDGRVAIRLAQSSAVW
jgi:TolA-binding protein